MSDWGENELMPGILLARRVSLAHAEGVDGGGRTSHVVVMLGEAEVNEHGADVAVLLAAEHYVSGLNVKMADALAVEMAHGVKDGPHQGARLLLAESAVLRHVSGKALALNVFHDVIRRVVGLKDLVEANDVVVREADSAEALRLVYKIFT